MKSDERGGGDGVEHLLSERAECGAAPRGLRRPAALEGEGEERLVGGHSLEARHATACVGEERGAHATEREEGQE